MAGFIQPISQQELASRRQSPIDLIGIVQAYQQGQDRKLKKQQLLKEEEYQNLQKQKLNQDIAEGEEVSKQRKLQDIRERSERQGRDFAEYLSNQNEEFTKSINRTKLLGDASTGLMSLASSENPEFYKDYEVFYSGLNQEIKGSFPKPSPSIRAKDMAQWSRSTAASSGSLVDYQVKMAKDNSFKQSEEIARIINTPPEERTTSQREYLEYYGQKDTNIFLSPPSTAKVKDAITFAGTLTHPDGTPLLSSMDKTSAAAYTGALSNLTDSIMASSVKSKATVPLDRTTAMTMAADTLYSNIKTKQSVLKDIPLLGDLFDKDYIFTPELNKTQQTTSTVSALPEAEINLNVLSIEQKLRTMPEGSVMTSGNKMWRINPSTGKLESK